MSVFSNVIKPQGLEPLQFPTKFRSHSLFGPAGLGLVAFGTTSEGTPVTTLDIVGHELMHGVTEFGVRQRNPHGLESFLHTDGLGPSSFVLDGQPVPCSKLRLVLSDGTRLSYLCSDGRFVLAANHGGTTHEAFADLFGTSTEFFFQNEGSGPLMGDYLMGEDIPEFTPRSLVSPTSYFVDTTRTARYPDHYSRRLRFAVLILEDNLYTIYPLAFDGTRFLELRGTDFGGVHWNSTILSHAFYLAVEGGQNGTSGISVNGVTAANRDQIERVFFRAVTELMPGALPLSITASVLCQAAVDLFGDNSAATMAVGQALYAVGLRPESQCGT